MFGWANIRNQNLFVGVLGGEIFLNEFNQKSWAFETLLIEYLYIIFYKIIL